MRIVVVTLGSRGDVQPYVALGRALQAAGHEFAICTHFDFEDFVREWGLGFFALPGDARQLLVELMGFGENLIEFIRRWIAFYLPIWDAAQDEIAAACRWADVVIYSQFGFAAFHPAEAYGRIIVRSALYPLDTTGDFPFLMSPVKANLGRAYNRLTFAMLDQAVHQMSRSRFNRWRRNLGLPDSSPFTYPYKTQNGQPIPTLYSFSPSVIPRPDDWDEHIHVCGYWFLDAPDDWQPSRELAAFLDAGPPPVYVGFGSMSGEDFRPLARIAIEALNRAGRRGLLSTGWGGLIQDELPENMLVIDSAPHDWLFPRMAAVVHHGGAGTTAAGLRAGVPSVIVPFFGDQPFWGRTVAELGVSPKPIRRKDLTADNLAYAIRVATSHEPMQQRAAELGEKIRAEDGIGNAVAIIQQLLEN